MQTRKRPNRRGRARARPCPTCGCARPVPLSGYRAVKWNGQAFWFRPGEVAAVRRLFERAAAGLPFVEADSLPKSLRDNDAWGRLIIPGKKCGGPAGTVCLATEAKS